MKTEEDQEKVFFSKEKAFVNFLLDQSEYELIKLAKTLTKKEFVYHNTTIDKFITLNLNPMA